MPAVSVRLPEELKIRLDRLSERTDQSKTHFVVEAIREQIGDLEALHVAEQRILKHRDGRSKSYT
jgi:predicted DNA-binding protein